MILNSEVSAVVSGGASGLGAATARRLASHGVKVAIFDRNEAAGTKIAKELSGVFCKVDVGSEEQVDIAFARARSVHGQERILVNCAAVYSAYKTASRNKTGDGFVHFPLADFELLVQVNLIGTFRCIAKSAAGMMTLDRLAGDERGVVVNTASIAAEDGGIGMAGYSASKSGIVGMTLPIARDLMNQGIRVNTILPGMFDTPLFDKLPETVKTSMSSIPCFPRRRGEPDEYAQAVEFLTTCEYMNGESIRIDGGIRMPPAY